MSEGYYSAMRIMLVCLSSGLGPSNEGKLILYYPSERKPSNDEEMGDPSLVLRQKKKTILYQRVHCAILMSTRHVEHNKSLLYELRRTLKM